ncbi:uncharacterized protein J3R85_013292 [Psidium guajava]|nr:uncharacterized protein J3R85_013292 [Psidium guajava]
MRIRVESASSIAMNEEERGNQFQSLAEKSFHPPLVLWIGGMIVARLHRLWFRFLLEFFPEHEILECIGRVVVSYGSDRTLLRTVVISLIRLISWVCLFAWFDSVFVRTMVLGPSDFSSEWVVESTSGNCLFE